MLPNIRFGNKSYPTGFLPPIEDDLDDDELLAHTPDDIVDILGFDPLKEDIVTSTVEVDGWACDEMEFKEELHPRDKGGKFTKGAGSKGGGKKAFGKEFATAYQGATHPKHAIHTLLKTYGYTPKGQTAAGHHEYEHPSGKKMYVGAATEGQGGPSAGLTAYRAGGGGEVGKGPGSLAKYLEATHGHEKAGETVSELPAPPPVPKAAEVKPETPANSGEKGSGNYISLTDISDKVNIYSMLTTDVEINGTIQDVFKGTLKGGVGHVILSKTTADWSVASSDYSVIETGNGLESFKTAIAKIEAANKKEEKVTSEPVVIENDSPIGKAVNYQSTEFGKFIINGKYEEGSSSNLLTGEQLYLSDVSGGWQLEKEGNILAAGTGEKSLNAAFEALHPRDEKGKFVKKTKEEISAFKYEKASDEPLSGLPEGSPDPSVKITGLWMNGSAERFSFGNEDYPDYSVVMGITPGVNLGKWQIYSKSHGGIIALGQGQAAFDKTFKAYLASTGQEQKPSPKATPAPPPAKPHKAVADGVIGFDNLKLVGKQLGSNPGGTYEDSDGNKFYVKQTDTDHARNEILAAALFGAAGGQTLTYYRVAGPDNMYVGTKWEELAKNNMSQLTPEQKKEAQKDFALHAWLANWDAAGMTGDNVGVTADGKVIPLDFGGSLLYRAKGSPKGVLFGDEVNEWDSLRNPSKNPQTAELYKGMTKEQLLESAARVGNITNEQIDDLVGQYGPGDMTARKALSAKLVSRRNDILQRAAAEVNKAEEPPKPVEKTPEELRELVAGWNPPDKPVYAVNDYKGSGYQEMNALMRYSLLEDEDTSSAAQHVRQITDWLEKASSKEDITVYRGYPPEVLKEYNKFAKPGRTLHDHGFMSMSTSKAFSDKWHGGAGFTIKIKVPAGSKIATVHNKGNYDHEYEVLAQVGYVIRITKWEHGAYEGVLEKTVGKAYG